MISVQVVSEPEASSPAPFVVPAAHAVHTCELTYSFMAQTTASQVVSAPDMSSPAALTVPAGHATQVFVDTR